MRSWYVKAGAGATARAIRDRWIEGLSMPWTNNSPAAAGPVVVGHPATRYIIRRIADRIADPTRFRDSHSHVGSGRDAFYARFTQEEGEN